MYIGKYKLLKTIGKGNFARVKLARHIPTGQEVTKVREKEERERERESRKERGERRDRTEARKIDHQFNS